MIEILKVTESKPDSWTDKEFKDGLSVGGEQFEEAARKQIGNLKNSRSNRKSTPLKGHKVRDQHRKTSKNETPPWASPKK